MEVDIMSLKLYNDLTRSKDLFEPLVPGKVSFYVCGPTVYDYFHIGNARPFIVFDVLRRYLEESGYKVTYVQNFTDIDDKMINRANSMGITVSELAEIYIAAYNEDAGALGVRTPSQTPRATHHIEDIIALVSRLVEKGHAYVVEGDVYFHVNSFAEYGRLSHQTLEDLQSGARIEVDPRKKHPLDFALWKSQKPGEPAWDSPWGMGRPGWHIECSAMSTQMLGETLDIHAGGCDLIFPHHENEIAQAEAATGKPFVRYWLHNGYLMIDKEKMSKSLGNFLTAREARKKFPALAIRLFMLSAHYRSPINFSEEGLIQAKNAAERLRNCWLALQEAQERKDETSKNPPLVNELDSYWNRFIEDLDDDFNTAGALGNVFEAVRALNTFIQPEGPLASDVLDRGETFFHKVEEIMGIIGIESTEEDPSEETARIDSLVQERLDAKKSRNFARADEIREQLAQEGIILEDTPQGTRWKRNI